MDTAEDVYRSPTMSRERRLLRLLIYVPLLVAVFCLLPIVGDNVALELFNWDVPARYIGAAVGSVAAFSFWVFRYLQYGVLDPFRRLLRAVPVARELVHDDTDAPFPDDDDDADDDLPRPRLKPFDIFVQEGDASSVCRESVSRLNAEIAALGRRNSVNLIFGFSSALGGIGLMYLSVLAKTRPASIYAFVYDFVPRFTLGAFMELFAYFFLRLYRNGLAEIKYYQNELTGIEARHVALLAAKAANHPATLDKVILAFAKTDRNQILQKGQTTAGIQLAKVDSAGVQAALAQVADIVKATVRPGADGKEK